MILRIKSMLKLGININWLMDNSMPIKVDAKTVNQAHLRPL